MGNYFEICCESRDKKIITPDVTSDEYTAKERETMREQSLLLNTKTRLPSNIMQMRIKTKNLIQKRIESPFEQYAIESNLGSGSFGTVYKVSHRSNKAIRALKQIPKMYITDGYSENQISNEIQILRLLDHPNIMKIYEFYEDSDNFYILSEFCNEGDLKSKCEKHGTFSEFNVKFFMYQILNAIAYLHKNRVIHGDIKLENILLYANNELTNQKNKTKLSKRLSSIAFDINIQDIQEELKHTNSNNNISNGNSGDDFMPRKALTYKAEQYLKSLATYEIKLIDFGCSKIFTKKKLNAIIGTSIYCSPEVIDNSFTEKCDEWSCGVLMYFLLAGEPPFYAETDEELFYKIKHDKVVFPKETFDLISNECIDLIKKLLNKDPLKRISAKDALKEPFFIGGVIPQLDNETEIIEEEIQQKLEEYKHFQQNKSKFQEMVLAYLALNYIDKDEETKIKKIFRSINKDHTTYQISKEEFRQFFTEYYQSANISNDTLNELFDVIDGDKNGSIEYQELLRALSDKEKLFSEDNLRAAFDFFDRDKSGQISWDEINTVIFEGRKVDDSLMVEYLGQIGKKKEDEITFEEFCMLVK